MTGRSGWLARATGLITFGAGLGLLMLARFWSTDVLRRSWLGPVLLVALLLAPLVWPVTDTLTTGHGGFLSGLLKRLER